MKHLADGSYLEVLADNYDYEIVEAYIPCGTHSLIITLETGEKIRSLHPFFVHMQSPSFVEDMQNIPDEKE